MSADLDALVALMPFAGQLGLVLDEAGADRVVARLDWRGRSTVTAQTSVYDAGERLVAQTTQVQAVR
jgi:hypothetical protein